MVEESSNLTQFDTETRALYNSMTPETASAVRCSYCGKLIQDDGKEEMGFETDNWGICADCVIEAMDGVGEKK